MSKYGNFFASSCLLSLAMSSAIYAGDSTWQSFNDGLVGADITAIALNTHRTNELDVATRFGGVYRSIDDGNTWTEVGNFNGVDVTALVINFKHPYEMFVGTQTDGVYRTNDYGQTWSAANNGLELNNNKNITVTGFAFNGTYPFEVYVTTHVGEGGGLYKTLDSGKTWIDMSGNLPSNNLITSFAINLFSPKTFLLGLGNLDGSRLFKTTDGGLHWQSFRTDLDNKKILQISYAPYDVNCLYAATDQGFFKTEEGVWVDITPSNLSDQTIFSFAINPDHPDEIYISTKAGIFKTTNDGANWIKINHGFDATSTRQIVMNLANTHELFLAAKPAGLYQTIDDGKSWHPLVNHLINLTITKIAEDKNHHLYAGTNTGQLWVKLSNQSWQEMTTLPKDHLTINDMAIDPNNAAHIVIARDATGHKNGAILYSKDAGATWQEATFLDRQAFNIVSLTINPAHPQQLFAASFSRHLYRSDDSGMTWRALPEPDGMTGYFAVAISPKNDKQIYASGAGGMIYKSENSGDTWQLFSGMSFSTTTLALAIHPVDANKMYLGLSQGDNTFYKSLDGGRNWIAAGAGLPTQQAINTIVIDPKNPHKIYVATGLRENIWHNTQMPGAGIYISTDDGEHFSAFNNGLKNLTVTTLLLDQDRLLAGTAGSGIFSLTLT